MTQQNLWRTFNENIITANIGWLFIHLPISLLTLLRTLTPGHSWHIKDQIYNTNWIYGYIPPFSLLNKTYVKRSEKIAQKNNSYVWALKAMCYKDNREFVISLNGKSLKAVLESNFVGLMATDENGESELYFKDFMIVDSNHEQLIPLINSKLSEYNNEIEYHNTKDSERNIHYDVKSLYGVDFNDNPSGQLLWIEDEILKRQKEILKFYNTEKLKFNI